MLKTASASARNIICILAHVATSLLKQQKKISRTGMLSFQHYVSLLQNKIYSERYALIDFLASAPLRGDVLAGTGGIRKVRFARGGRGKSGGVRVIYYFYTAAKPIYLLEIFGKNEKANLAVAERNALAKVAAEIKQQLQRRQK